MKKKIAIGSVIIAILAAAVAALAYFWFQSGDAEAIAALKLNETLFPTDQYIDQSKLSFPPPANKKELSKLMDYIVELRFPECQGIKEGKSDKVSETDYAKTVGMCQMRLYYEVTRLDQIRAPDMVPGLIEMAMKRTEEYNLPEHFSPEQKVQFNMDVICKARFCAINALGEIGDPRAIKPLLALVDEATPMGTAQEIIAKGCFDFDVVSRPNRPFSKPCGSVGKALRKFQTQLDPSIIPSLLEGLDNFPPEKFDETKLEAGYIIYEPFCKLHVVSMFGPEGLKKLLEKYNEPRLSEYARKGVSDFIGEISDPAAVPMLRELLHGKDKMLAENAAVSLGAMTRADLVEEYLWMIDNGYCKIAIHALGKVKDPSTVQYLLKLLEKNDPITSSSAVYALIEFGPAAKEAVPALSTKLDLCTERYGCGIYAQALGSIGDERALPSLFEFAHKSTGGDGMEAAIAITNIGSNDSVDYLKRILATNGDKMENGDFKYYGRVRQAALDGLLKLLGDKAIPEICTYKDDPQLKLHLAELCK